MSPARHWAALTRVELAELVPHAVCLLPLGSTEQHGPHLATGADHVLAAAVAERGAAVARTDRPLLLLPTLSFGASGHHLPFGGTLSLTQEALRMVLTDLVDSLVGAGARRLVVVNGHGGNRPTCASLVHDESIRGRLVLATVSYWELDHAELIGPAGFFGHAGPGETELLRAVDATLVRDVPVAIPPAQCRRPLPGSDWAIPGEWERVDGYVDPGSRAVDGDRMLAASAQGIAAVIDAVAALDLDGPDDPGSETARP